MSGICFPCQLFIDFMIKCSFKGIDKGLTMALPVG